MGLTLTITLVIYAVLFIPTLFMGATLPILVAHLNRHHRHIGRSVGALYFFNTIGSAIASLVTVDVLFALMGRQATVVIAAGCNLLVAGLVAAYCRKVSHVAVGPAASAGTAPALEPAERSNAFSYPLALLLGAATGYVSLSQEIVWMRALSYASGGMPHVFGHILGFFLFGVAAGTVVGKRVSETPGVRPLRFIGWMFLATALVYYASIPITGMVVAKSWVTGMLAGYGSVALVAFLLGSIFPVLCHFGIRPDAPVGLTLSGIYVANIVGSTAGPLVTGFLLMDRLTLEQIILVLSVLALGVAAAVGLLATSGVRSRATVLGGAVLTGWALFLGRDPAYGHLLERLLFHREFLTPEGYQYVLQNRSGILSVIRHERGDIIYGGGVYDGRFNVDPVINSNGIVRAYMIAGLHPKPEQVLEIGLSSGSWTWVVAAHAAVKHVTVVEINPGYLDLIDRYPEQRTVLSDPKVSIAIDDGRRWLKRHPETRFDLILMNTWHWRSNATNLLSREFLELCRAHLKEGGVIYYNTTGSEDVVRTAAEVFKHVTTLANFVAASDRPFDMTREQRRDNLLRFTAEGRTLLDPALPATRTLLEELAVTDFQDIGPAMRKRADLHPITEDNMLTEYKTMQSQITRFYRLFDPEKSWSRFRPDSDTAGGS